MDGREGRTLLIVVAILSSPARNRNGPQGKKLDSQ